MDVIYSWSKVGQPMQFMIEISFPRVLWGISYFQLWHLILLCIIFPSDAISLPICWFVIIFSTQGSTFGEVIEMTDIFEGSIIRLVRRLDEFLNQVDQLYLAPWIAPYSTCCFPPLVPKSLGQSERLPFITLCFWIRIYLPLIIPFGSFCFWIQNCLPLIILFGFYGKCPLKFQMNIIYSHCGMTQYYVQVESLAGIISWLSALKNSLTNFNCFTAWWHNLLVKVNKWYLFTCNGDLSPCCYKEM
jgi:hypothetical protein